MLDTFAKLQLWWWMVAVDWLKILIIKYNFVFFKSQFHARCLAAEQWLEDKSNTITKMAKW